MTAPATLRPAAKPGTYHEPVLERRRRYEPETAAPGAARRLVAGAVAEAGLDIDTDLLELLVSEVVTNAVLHAGSDIEVTCRVTGAGARVDVRDWSPVLPLRRHYEDEAMTGRGLELVEMLATDCGVRTLGDGKVVWFQVGNDPGNDAPPDGERWSAGDSAGATVAVHLLGVPVPLVWAALQYSDAMLRELAFLMLAADGEGEPETWRAPQLDIGPIVSAVEEGRANGRESMDVVLEFPRSAASAALERIALVDEADRLARRGELLSVPAVPEIGAVRHWLYGQIALQAEGALPTAWVLPSGLEPEREPVVLTARERAGFDRRTEGVVVADDTNRIVHVNPAAAVLLGWDADALEGRRLTVLVPHRLREAHLAGFTHYQLTGEGRILGQELRLPALRREGTEVEVTFTVETVPFEAGSTGFVASMDLADR